MNKAIGWVLVVSMTAACSGTESKSTTSSQPKSAQFGTWGVELEHLSDTVDPGDDFYRYVNEGWIESTSLPRGYSFYSEPWVAQARALTQVEEIVRNAVQGDLSEGSAEKRVADLYAAYMDTSAVDERGLRVLAADLDAILRLNDYEGIAAWMANPRSNSVFHLLVQPPVTMRGGYILTLAQYRVTGLGLPGQEYYESDEQNYQDVRRSYVAFIASTLSRAGVDRPGERAKEILELETAYANVMWDFARLRDAGAAFNLIPRPELEDHAPGFPWQAFLEARGVGDIESINIGVGALSESAALFEQFSVETWASFLAFHWINNHADLLPEPFGSAAFDFYESGLWGVEDRKIRSERALEFVQRHLGDDIGVLYTQKYFPDAYREKVDELVFYIRKAFRERLRQTDWMDEPTKAEALAKLDAIIVEVGLPSAGIDWSKLLTRPDDLVGNYTRLMDYQWEAQRARIGRPITRYGDWNMHPHRIGAGYHQQYNKIFVTAGAMLAPFFDPNADPAVNFGAIGQTIAHEFGHALDDQGSRFDRNGVLRDWWSRESRAMYQARTGALIEQYAEYSPVSGVFLASRQMIGEIVGDLVGTSIAYRAYELYVEDHYEDGAPVLDGFTGGQRFFLSTAQQSRTIATEQQLRDIALNWSHAPARYRVNGVLRNMEEWHRDFAVKPDSSLYLDPGDRVTLW
ncbi:MAG: M13 family metallopeptidase [Woeseiaceae bacterium]|nr:M13 family metallopeptidase [Woeseiaceae bacterium]